MFLQHQTLFIISKYKIQKNVLTALGQCECLSEYSPNVGSILFLETNKKNKKLALLYLCVYHKDIACYSTCYYIRVITLMCNETLFILQQPFWKTISAILISTYIWMIHCLRCFFMIGLFIYLFYQLHRISLYKKII